jgi:hypothetical protein
MTTKACRDLNRQHRLAAREEKASRAAVRTANAAVVTATKTLAPHWVTSPQAQTERAAVQPLVDAAQAASNKWWKAAADLDNATRAAASCKVKI